MKSYHVSLWASIYISFIVLLFSICFVRAYYLQVEEHTEHSIAKKKLTTSYITIRSPRGNILDQRGFPLAMSIRSYSCCLYPRMIPKNLDKVVIAQKLSRITHVPESVILEKLNSDSYFQWVKRILTDNEEIRLRKLKETDYTFLDFVPEFERRYPGSKSLSQVLGYTGIDDQGLAGIELSTNKWLAGQEFKIYMRKDNRGNRILPQLESPTDQIRKKNVVLTIDSVIQTFTEDAVKLMVEKFKPAGAVGIVCNVNNGDILAMVSFPRFDNNRYKEFNLETMRNRAVNYIYEPGSTFKTFTFAAAYNEGAINEKNIIDCGPGYAKIGPRTLRDSHPNGKLSTEEVLSHSSNIGTAKVAMKLGNKTFSEYIFAFGFGKKTGLELSGEENGILRQVDKWSSYSLASIAMGQEVSVTPIQMVSAYCAIANGGILIKPRIIKQVLLDDGTIVKEWPVEEVRRVISVETSRRVLNNLQMVVDSGTGKAANSLKYTVGGKTGTSQKVINGVYSNIHHIGSFVGISPIENPKIVVLVLLDDPLGLGYGGTVAAPAVQSIIDNTLEYLQVPPSKIVLSELVEPPLQ